MDPIERVREICLALPEATEQEAWGEATFRVGGKMFAMADVNHHHSGHVAIWCKAPEGAQDVLVGSAPERFFIPPYVGKRGWIGIRLDGDGTDWDEVADLLCDSYRMTAPKKLVKRLDG